jgi:hypothetical protein
MSDLNYFSVITENNIQILSENEPSSDSELILFPNLSADSSVLDIESI